MTVRDTILPGVLLLEPKVFGDARGFFLEIFQAARYRAFGIDQPFVQDNHSRSVRGTLRGLHFQRREVQGKLVQVVRGHVFDVVVDLRAGSPTFGQHATFDLSEDNHHQLWIPPGLAHGFYVRSEVADFVYKCTAYYQPTDEGGIRWDDPDLAIAWPDAQPLVSPKDASLPFLCDLTAEDLPIIHEVAVR